MSVANGRSVINEQSESIKQAKEVRTLVFVRAMREQRLMRYFIKRVRNNFFAAQNKLTELKGVLRFKHMNDLPDKIEAFEYSEMCGNTELGTGILMLDDQGEEICRLTRGTIQEKKIALLWQASLDLLEWAKHACESERAFYDLDDGRTVPSWLPELESAIKFAEHGELH